jgi:hypothetical protein
MEENQGFELRLRVRSRAGIESNRIDLLRFIHASNYLTLESLQYFRDACLRDLFVQIFWRRPENPIPVIDAFIQESGNTTRLKQVRDAILHHWVRDGKLVFPYKTAETY